MQNPVFGTQNALLIPPPPPPPSFSCSRICSSSREEELSATEASHSSKLSQACRHVVHLLGCKNPIKIVSFYRPIKSILQDEYCGSAVALITATDLLDNVDVGEKLNSFVEPHCKNTREIFSTYSVAHLPSNVVDNCDVQVVNLQNNEEYIFHHVCDGWPLLIPYDANMNHSPCLNKGNCVNWAVITGLCFPVSEDTDIIYCSDFIEGINCKIYQVSNGQHVKSLLNSATRVFVYAHHGKSTNVAAWDFNELIKSNLNLNEVRKESSENELFLPENNNVHSELRDKAVILKKKESPSSSLNPSREITFSLTETMPTKSTFLKLSHAYRHITHLFDFENPTKMISFYRAVKPILQDGRCCGIVALAMASQLIDEVHPIDLFKLAVALHFSKRGELFSAYNVAQLASSSFNCDAWVVEDLCSNKKDILDHICDGWPLLIAYDTDKNHSPCLNKGYTAHWAVVTGLCFSVPEDTDITSYLDSKDGILDFPEFKVYQVNNCEHVKSLLNFATKIFVYAHQGKSRHLAAWDFNELLMSNLNLFEITKRYSEVDLVLPEGNDALFQLRDKVVLLKKRVMH